MVALEVLVNGKPLYTMGVGEFGMVTARVEWMRIQKKSGSIYEEVRVCGSGMQESNNTHPQWPRTELSIGDVVTVRVIDTDLSDPPSEIITNEDLRKFRQDQKGEQ